ncbi:MAG: HIT domain-containing protein [Thiohalobacterales bacterium]|nr:HIT domain-containing protein [Thiohalobacterales bacterium]
MDIHPTLQRDCHPVGRFPLCHLLLMLDANYPWFILVPAREGISEIHQLATGDRQSLMQESVVLSQAMERAFTPDKLNIAALGNIVPQLHIHHIARYHDDAAWPDPVWGRVARRPYSDDTRDGVLHRLTTGLQDEGGFTRA